MYYITFIFKLKLNKNVNFIIYYIIKKYIILLFYKTVNLVLQLGH